MNTLPEPPPFAPDANRRLVWRLLWVVAGAFAFGFAMVPFYNMLCKVTGLNGKTADFQAGGIGGAGVGSAGIDLSRTVTVEFTGTVMPGLPWEMRPLTASLNVHPGELKQVFYRVHNASDQPLVGQAIPSVSPGQAARHFQKLECFCFRQQTLAPGETREMPLSFILKPELDHDIRQITLSYAFFKVPAAPRETP